MSQLEERVDGTLEKINSLHDSLNRTDWSSLKRDGFVFELERATSKLKQIYSDLEMIDKEVSLLLEKNTPDISGALEQIQREVMLLESNVKLEKHKRFKVELVNQTEPVEVPDLYSSLQNKILECVLKARYSTDKIRTFLIAKKVPFVQRGSTAKSLIDVLQKKEDELSDLRKRNVDLKRKSFLGHIDEKSLAEIEDEMFTKDKSLSMAVSEANKALKTHLAQINYVEGSFAGLKEKVRLVEELHSAYSTKASGLIRELKKDRDYARKMALEIENETLQARTEYTRNLLEKEDRINTVKEKVKRKYTEEIRSLRRDLNEKSISLANVIKLIEKLEAENKSLKEKLNNKVVSELKEEN
jgi:hypothetical protein